MNLTTTILVGSGITIASTSASVDEAGNIKPERRNEFIGTTASAVTTTVAGYIINNNTMQQVHNKYSRSYVESLSDTELENALQEMNLLASNNSTNSDTKTL